MEIFKEVLPYIITALIGIVTAIGTLITSYLKNKKAKLDYSTKLSEERTKYIALEEKKTQLEIAMIEGAFIICPKCNSKILAKDLVFYTQEVKVNENEKKT